MGVLSIVLWLLFYALQVLDFDFEKFCSVSLSNLNVYACLVCGKYYQGRGKKSHAYTHSLEAGHHVYINLQTEQVYCLPDGYEIDDPSLDDIRHVLNPRCAYIFAKCFHYIFPSLFMLSYPLFAYLCVCVHVCVLVCAQPHASYGCGCDGCQLDMFALILVDYSFPLKENHHGQLR